MKKFAGELSVVFVVLALACGREHDSKSPDPVTADVAVANLPAEAVPAPSDQQSPAAPQTEAPTPPVGEALPAEPEHQTPTTPTFEEATYLAGQEVRMLAFVEKLKGLQAMQPWPDFLKPTERDMLLVTVFTTAEGKYRADLYEPFSNETRCGYAGTVYQEVNDLWRVGSYPGTYPLGVEYQLFGFIKDGVLMVSGAAAHWKTLDGVHHYYDSGVTCEDGTPVLPTVNPANF